MRRTIQTASHFKLPITQWRALIEIQVGVCDNMSYEEIQDKMPQEAEGRKKDKLRYRSALPPLPRTPPALPVLPSAHCSLLLPSRCPPACHLPPVVPDTRRARATWT